MTVDSPFLKPLILLGSTVFIAQSLVWVALSVVGILSYAEVIELEVVLESPIRTLLHLYFTELADNNEDSVITGKLLLGFCIVYLIVSVVWIVISGMAINAVNSNNRYLKNISFALTGETYSIALIDLILCILFGVEYDRVQDLSLDATAVFILLTVAIRGFFLWIFNVAISSAIIYVITQDDKGQQYERRYEERASVASAFKSHAPRNENVRMQAPWHIDNRWTEVSTPKMDFYSEPNVLANSKPAANKPQRFVPPKQHYFPEVQLKKPPPIPDPDYSPLEERKFYGGGQSRGPTKQRSGYGPGMR